MTEYVLVYVYNLGSVPMIRKARPAWQAGLWNLPGGKIEPGEGVVDAAVRELREETGLIPAPRPAFGPPRVMGRIAGESYVVYVVALEATMGILASETDSGEVAAMWSRDGLLGARDVIGNVKILVALCESWSTGWTLEDLGAGRGGRGTAFRLHFDL